MANKAKPISFAPLKFDDAVSGLLQIPPAKKFCECGCGKPLKGEANFLRGHDLRKIVRDSRIEIARKRGKAS